MKKEENDNSSKNAQIEEYLSAQYEFRYNTVLHRAEYRSRGEGDVSKLLAFPSQDEGAELSRRMFLFSVFTGLAFVDLQGLRASQIETNSEGKRYIRKARQKTEVESLIPMHPIAEQILTLYTKEKSRGDYKIFPDTMSDWKLLRHLKAVGLACGIRTPLTWHCARHTFGTLTLEAGVPIESIAKMMAFVYCQHTNLCPSHRPKDCKGYGEGDAKDTGMREQINLLRHK